MTDPIVFIADNSHLVVTVPGATIRELVTLAFHSLPVPDADALSLILNHEGDITIMFTSKPADKIEVIR